jgi:hypothetical protein
MMTCCSATACGCLRWPRRSGCVQPVDSWACTTRPITAGSVGSIAGGSRRWRSARAGGRGCRTRSPPKIERVGIGGPRYPSVALSFILTTAPEGADPRANRPAAARAEPRPRWARTFLPGPKPGAPTGQRHTPPYGVRAARDGVRAWEPGGVGMAVCPLSLDDLGGVAAGVVGCPGPLIGTCSL